MGTTVRLTNSPLQTLSDGERRRQRQRPLTVPLMPSNVLAWKTLYSRDHFQPPEYNLTEVGRAADVESYVRQAVDKKVGLMFKSGWSIVGPDDDVVLYLQERFRQLEQAANKPMDILLREVGSDLVLYHNAYLVKARDRQASGGLPRKDLRWRKTLNPVAAYFRMSPETVWIRRDIYGNVLQYRQQTPYGVTRLTFEPEDVVHFYVNRRGGLSVGTPSLIPVLDDIRALRRLEENIELLIHQHLFPLLHYQVGTQQQPAAIRVDGSSELDEVRRQLQTMATEGCIITPEHHQIEVIGTGGKAMRADWYLEHFKQRLFAGLGMSAMDFGEGGGANRSTAERLSRALIDNVKNYQGIMAAFINHEVIQELLLESTWGEAALAPERRAYFVFSEVDQDAQVKREAAVVNLYHAHLIDEDEARLALGRQPIRDVQRARMFFEMVEKPKAIIQALDEPFSTRSTSAPERTLLKTGASGATIEPPATVPAGTPATRRARNIVQPTNQHGTKPGPEPRLSSLTTVNWVDSDADLQTIHNIWQQEVQTLQLSGTPRSARLHRFMQQRLLDAFYHGLHAGAGTKDPTTVAAGFMLVAHLTRHLDAWLETVPLRSSVSDAALSYRYRLWCRRAYWWGVVQAWKQRGVVRAWRHLDARCDAAAGAVWQPLLLEAATMDEMPPCTPDCRCCLALDEDPS